MPQPRRETRHSRATLALAAASTLLCLACAEDNARPAGLAPSPQTDRGPVVVFDLDARPLPEIPFPNDLATRVDFDSPTGRRVNVSEIAPTMLETGVRDRINDVDGFGIYAPISIAFEGPIALEPFVTRHQENTDFADDLVYVLNVDPESECYGEATMLDMGRGNFPLSLKLPNVYYPHDPRGGTSNLIFDTTDEDLNGNGLLDPGEDTDFDNVLDVPNVFGGDDAFRDLLTFYERETNTLIMRPLVPLCERATHAVVVTRDVHGENGSPVRSPFEYVNHTRQTLSLQPLLDVMANHPEYGLNTDRIAFAWTFTTASVTNDLYQLRRGLYGHGAMGWIAEEFPAEVAGLERMLGDADPEDNYWLFPRNRAELVLRAVIPAILGADPEQVSVFAETYRYVSYFVGGSFDSPNFLVDRDGLATEDNPQDDDEVFEIDVDTGEAVYGTNRVTFWCAIPRALEGEHEAPYPVVLYAHGYGLGRYMMFLFAGSLARHGLATCSIDAYGHGFFLPEGVEFSSEIDVVRDVLNGAPALESFQRGRARDLTNDGFADPGFDFVTADTHHTRDMFRQTAIDWMQLIRVLRGFDGTTRWAFDTDDDGQNELAGDWDADGTPDVGGETQYFMFGTSLGGITTNLVSGVEPALTAAASNAGGGGLVDIGIRAIQPGVPEIVIMGLLGPFVLGEDNPDGEGIRLSWLINDGIDVIRLPIGVTTLIEPGDQVVVVNTSREQRPPEPLPDDERWAVVGEDGVFRLAVPADAMSASERRARFGATRDNPYHVAGDASLALGDAVSIEVWSAEGVLKGNVDEFLLDSLYQGVLYEEGSRLVAPALGWGLRRGTPALRRFTAVAQMVVEPGDPIAFAPRYMTRPLDYSDIEPNLPVGTRMLITATPGDQNVPINTAVAVARAAGIIDLTTIHPEWDDATEMEVLIDHFVVEGIPGMKRFGDATGAILFDVDDLDDGVDGRIPEELNLSPPLRITRELDTGIMALRLPYTAPGGTHGFNLPRPSLDFDIHTYMIHQIGIFFTSGGTELRDDPCLEDVSCEDIPTIVLTQGPRE